MTQLNGILEVEKLNGTPARADHRNGIILLSKSHFDKIKNPIFKEFIIAHEEGHLVLNTKNEEQADDYAMKKLLKKGYPLSKILGSLTQVLQYDKIGHYGRTNRLFDKLFLYDLIQNKNQNLLNNLNLINMETPIDLENIYTQSYESEFSDFLGLGKKAKERRQQRQEARMEKKAAKNEMRKAKAEVEKAKADAIRETGVIPESGTGLKNILGGVGKAVGSILGKGTSDEDTLMEKSTVDTTQQKKSNTTTYIIIAVIVLLLIVAAYFIFFRGKKK